MIATPDCRPKDATTTCNPGPSGGESAPPRAARPQTKLRPLAPWFHAPGTCEFLGPRRPDALKIVIEALAYRFHKVATQLADRPRAPVRVGRDSGASAAANTVASNPYAKHSRAANLAAMSAGRSVLRRGAPSARCESEAASGPHARRMIKAGGGLLAGVFHPVSVTGYLTKIACSRLVPAGRLSRSGISAKRLPLGLRIQKRARGDSVPTITSPAYLAREAAGAM